MFVGYIESLIPHVGWMNSGAMRTVTVQVLTSVPPRRILSISPTATYLGLIRSNSDTPDPRRMIAINGAWETDYLACLSRASVKSTVAQILNFAIAYVDFL
jgi:hypothetical protein